MNRAPCIQHSCIISLFLKPCQSLIILVSFLVNIISSLPDLQAQELRLPIPGIMLHLSHSLNPPVFKGVTVYPDNPFKFDFILDQGDSRLSQQTPLMASHLKKESKKLIKYFLASITTPENDLWVNLSPYEKNRIIPESFGQTNMGRDLLAEDYILKQITASLIYPEEKTGKRFWKRIYEEALKKFGTTSIPVNTFNKVWIVPDHAKVYEHGHTAFVLKARLKVMLEEDYLALKKNNVETPFMASSLSPEGSPLLNSKEQGILNRVSTINNTSSLGSQIIRELIIPELTREVNEGQNFATLRQAYYSLILAVWFKKRLKESLLGRKFVDQNKIVGLSYSDNEKGLKDTMGNSPAPIDIYNRYLKAFKKGVYNYIKEEADPLTHQIVPRKYFSGGVVGKFNPAQITYSRELLSQEKSDLPIDSLLVSVNLSNLPPSKAIIKTQAMKSQDFINDAAREKEFVVIIQEILSKEPYSVFSHELSGFSKQEWNSLRDQLIKKIAASKDDQVFKHRFSQTP